MTMIPSPAIEAPETTARLGAPVPDPGPGGGGSVRLSRRARFLQRSRTRLALYGLLAPTLVAMLVFGYYPKVDVLVKSLYRWTPGTILEYVGAKNYLDAFADPIFWQSFRVVAIMLVANLVKLWPGIIVAIALHRLASDRWRYIYQVCFVIPMVVPAMVWLLVWKSFYDPDFGILNRLLSATGAMSVLGWLDGTAAEPGLMPNVADALAPVLGGLIDPLFGGVWAMILFAAALLARVGPPAAGPGRWLGYAAILTLAALLPLLGSVALTGALPLLGSIAVLVGLLAVTARTLGQNWVIWPFILLYGVWACYGEPVWRLPVMLAIALGVAEAVHAASPRWIAEGVLRWAGLGLAVLGSLLVAFGLIWTEPTEQFAGGSPAWLGNQDLILPALIFWGFPWVGTVGVLIYLAGLQQISTDVYEAAELDGVSPLGKLFRIELPLIMTQVRINLILMTISTLTAYEFYLILLGQEGGPGNVGMVPGLYMYKSAFIDQRYGYACALGMVLFVVILLLDDRLPEVREGGQVRLALLIRLSWKPEVAASDPMEQAQVRLRRCAGSSACRLVVQRERCAPEDSGRNARALEASASARREPESTSRTRRGPCEPPASSCGRRCAAFRLTSTLPREREPPMSQKASKPAELLQARHRALRHRVRALPAAWSP